MKLGLSQTDAEVYIHLATKGPQEAGPIAESLKLQSDLLYSTLEKLKQKGVVTPTFQQYYLFSALPFYKALDILVRAHVKETREIEKSKNEILSNWKAMIDDGKN